MEYQYDLVVNAIVNKNTINPGMNSIYKHMFRKQSRIYDEKVPELIILDVFSANIS